MPIHQNRSVEFKQSTVQAVMAIISGNDSSAPAARLLRYFLRDRRRRQVCDPLVTFIKYNTIRQSTKTAAQSSNKALGSRGNNKRKRCQRTGRRTRHYVIIIHRDRRGVKCAAH